MSDCESLAATGTRRWTMVRFLAAVFGLTTLILAVLGGAVTLFANWQGRADPDTGSNVPQIRQLDRESLRWGDGRVSK